MRVWEQPGAYFGDFLARAGADWHHSEWDFRRVIAAGPAKVHLDVQFTRYRIADCRRKRAGFRMPRSSLVRQTRRWRNGDSSSLGPTCDTATNRDPTQKGDNLLKQNTNMPRWWVSRPLSVRQMRGTAPAQIPGAKISVCHGIGGMFPASRTIIFSNERRDRRGSLTAEAVRGAVSDQSSRTWRSKRRRARSTPAS
jgi:hypothetical protein